EEEFELFEKLFFEITYFNIKIEDEIVPFTISDQPFYRNAASTLRNGVECGLKGEFLKGLELIVNYTYTNFKYQNYAARHYNAVGEPIDTSYDNNFMPAVPKHALGCIIEYKYRLSKNLYGLLQFDFDYVSNMYTDDGNSEQTDSYLYANPMAGANFVFGNMGILLAGGIKNIF